MISYETVQDTAKVLVPSLMNSLSSLIYSKFISLFRKQTKPAERIIVPSVNNIAKFLDRDSEFTRKLQANLFDSIKDAVHNNELYKPYENKFDMFDESARKTFNEDLIPTVEKRIPFVIRRKFDIDGEGNSIFKEDRDLELFTDFSEDEIYNYLTYEMILNIIVESKSYVCKYGEDEKLSFTDKDEFVIYPRSILCIKNVMAISPIYIDLNILNLNEINKLIEFITHSTFKEMTDFKCNDKFNVWTITTNQDNWVSVYVKEPLEYKLG